MRVPGRNDEEAERKEKKMVLILAAWREKQETWGEGSEHVATPGPRQGHLVFLREQLWGHPDGT